MFMDLKSSTTVAEKLGHLKYSSFIRDSFMDINEVVPLYNAQVYQYVGDEIVLSWNVNDGLKDFSLSGFSLPVKKNLMIGPGIICSSMACFPISRQQFIWGWLPPWKSAKLKRYRLSRRYLNTTARIQNVCNEYNRKFLISAYLLEKIGL